MRCANCGAVLNPEVGKGRYAPVTHLYFCDNTCYRNWTNSQRVELSLQETEAGNTVPPVGSGT